MQSISRMTDGQPVSSKEQYAEKTIENGFEGEDPYSICPDCGQKLSSLNDGGNGFCTECAGNH